MILHHYEWEDVMRIENDRIYRTHQSDDSGKWVINSNLLEIDWDKWGKEYFLKWKNGEYYSCEVISWENKTCYMDIIHSMIYSEGEEFEYHYEMKDDKIKIHIKDDTLFEDELSTIQDYVMIEKNKQSLRKSTSSIPKIIHFIFGLLPQNEEFSLYRYLAIKSAKDVNQPHILYFHYHYEPYGEWWEKTKEIVTLHHVEIPQSIFGHPLCHYAHQADILRLQFLNEYGGIYLDIDTICINSFDNLLEYDFVMGIQGSSVECEAEKEIYGLCNAVMLAKPNSIFGRLWYESYQTFRSEGRDQYWDEHSVLIPLKLWKENKNDIQIMDYHSFFYPLWNEIDSILFSSHIQKDIYKNIIQKNYCIHLWDTYTHSYLKTIDYDSIWNRDTIYHLFCRKFLRNNISLLFLTYNRLEITKRCLESYLKVLDREDVVEMMILDNHSDEETRNYLYEFEKMHKKIKIIYSDKNLGVCHGRKVLFHEADGDILISLDSDAYLENEIFIDKIKEKLYEEKYGIVGVSGAFLTSWKFGSQKDIDDLDENEYQCDHIAGCCQAFRKELFIFDIDLDPFYDKFWVEDTDFSMQMIQLGKINYRIPQKNLLTHHWGGSGKEFSNLFEKHWDYFVKKWKGKVLNHIR